MGWGDGAGQPPRRLRRDAARTHLVDLVPDDDLHNGLGDVRLELRVPPRERVERLAVRDVVHEDDPLRAAIIRGRDRPEALLTRRVLHPRTSQPQPAARQPPPPPRVYEGCAPICSA